MRIKLRTAGSFCKLRDIFLALFIVLAAIGVAGVLLEENAPVAEGDGVMAHGALHVDGSALMDEHGNVVSLNGVSSHGIEWYPRYLNGSAMQTLKEWGANVQRIAMYTDTQTGYIREPEENLNYLYMGIESALSADMYVIIDWHIMDDGNPNRYVNEAVNFFREISKHYGDHPGLIYEICNEPNGSTSWEEIRRYANRVIPEIRKNAPNAVILVGTPDFCTDFTGPLERPLTYENIMYTMHRYIDVSKEAPCDNYLIEDVVEAGLPVFVSEWGTGIYDTQSGQKKGAEHSYQENAQPFLDYMREHNISWVAWALSNKDESHGILNADCEKLSGWIEEDLTSFGKLVFSELARG